MFKKAIGSVALIVCSLCSFSQIKEYTYKFQVNGLKEKDTVYLANYYGKGLYYFDTAYVAKNGTFTFHKKKELKPGVFAVVPKGTPFLEIILSEPAFSVKSDTNNIEASASYEGSPENIAFKEYKDFMITKNREMGPIRAEMDSAKDATIKEDLKKKLIKSDEEVKAFQKKFTAEHKDLFVGQMISMLLDIDVPDAPKDASGKVTDSTWTYYYYREHFFDRVDLKNDFMVNCPIFHNKLENYFKDVVLQHPDTIVMVTKRLTDKMNQKGEMLKYTVTHVGETYNKSEIMGMDAVFVGLADVYYYTGKAFWVDSARMVKVKEYVEKIRPLLIGKPAIALSLADSTHKNWLKLYNEKSEYTVLVFWEPTCGHCQKEMPILAEMFNKTKGADFGVYAVSSDSDEKWKKFIVDHKMNFTNVAVPSEVKKDQNELYKLVTTGKTDEKSLNYHTTYDVFSTPKVFVLDKNKKIVAKQVSIESLEGLLKQLRDIEKNKKS